MKQFKRIYETIIDVDDEKLEQYARDTIEKFVNEAPDEVDFEEFMNYLRGYGYFDDAEDSDDLIAECEDTIQNDLADFLNDDEYYDDNIEDGLRDEINEYEDSIVAPIYEEYMNKEGK